MQFLDSREEAFEEGEVEMPGPDGDVGEFSDVEGEGEVFDFGAGGVGADEVGEDAGWMVRRSHETVAADERAFV